MRLIIYYVGVKHGNFLGIRMHCKARDTAFVFLNGCLGTYSLLVDMACPMPWEHIYSGHTGPLSTAL